VAQDIWFSARGQGFDSPWGYEKPRNFRGFFVRAAKGSRSGWRETAEIFAFSLVLLVQRPILSDIIGIYPLGSQMATWLDLDELAKHLKTPKSTLYKLVRCGTIPGHKVGRSYRFDRDEVDAAIKHGRTTNSKKKGHR
jgi:excisionase family DNA binding protein